MYTLRVRGVAQSGPFLIGHPIVVNVVAATMRRVLPYHHPFHCWAVPRAIPA